MTEMSLLVDRVDTLESLVVGNPADPQSSEESLLGQTRFLKNCYAADRAARLKADEDRTEKAAEWRKFWMTLSATVIAPILTAILGGALYILWTHR